jgi:type IV fimbrial biogenesis protein FimT
VRAKRGFSIVELLVIVGVLGILLAIGFANIPRDGFAVNQAARGLSAQITRARLEAIRTNCFALVRMVNTGNGGYDVVVRRDATGQCDPLQQDVIQSVRFGQGEHGGVRLTATTLNEIEFDPRGVRHNATPGAITLASNSGAQQRIVVISATGRAAIQ